MTITTSAPVIPLVQPKRPRTAAERQQACRERKKAAKAAQLPAVIPPSFSETGCAHTTPTRPVTLEAVPQTAELRRLSAAPLALRLTAFGLAGTGLVINGWFSRSLGSTDSAGYLFLAIGVAADCAALVLPSCAAGQWQARQWGTAMAGWAVWLATFVFAVTAGIGFASVNISDVTLSRASRSSPAMVAAQTALTDAMASRDRECKGGVGKFCREREAAVAGARDKMDSAMAGIASTADPQTEAAIKLVSWLTRGTVTPTGNDFVMLRLMLLALLPQIGGVLMLVSGRTSR
jgi:hypothetical protein